MTKQPRIAPTAGPYRAIAKTDAKSRDDRSDQNRSDRDRDDFPIRTTGVRHGRHERPDILDHRALIGTISFEAARSGGTP